MRNLDLIDTLDIAEEHARLLGAIFDLISWSEGDAPSIAALSELGKRLANRLQGQIGAVADQPPPVAG